MISALLPFTGWRFNPALQIWEHYAVNIRTDAQPALMAYRVSWREATDASPYARLTRWEQIN